MNIILPKRSATLNRILKKLEIPPEIYEKELKKDYEKQIKKHLRKSKNRP